jgi:hypothetical protein
VASFNRDVVDKQAGRYVGDIANDPEVWERNEDVQDDQETEENDFAPDFIMENDY